MKGKPLCFCLEVNSSIVQGYAELHEQPMKMLEKATLTGNVINSPREIYSFSGS
jgi:hypothetical protein